MMFRQARLWGNEEAVLNSAVLFTASASRGRAVYDIREAPTLDAALTFAPELYEDRPIAIYAYDAAGRSAMLGSWVPDR